MSPTKSTSHIKQPITVTAHPVTVTRIIRRMRGGSQSILVQCDDDQYYVAKLLGNPQGRRTLMIELIVAQLIRQFDVLTPPLALLNLPERFLNSNEYYFLMGNKRIRPEGTLHLGSRVPVNPETTAIFDFLPIRLIPKVRNLSDFATMFVLDKWFHQTDYRQAVFVRDTSSRGIEYLAHFIDHGRCFDWEIGDAPLHGLALQKNLYSEIKMRDLTRAVLPMVAEVSEQMLLKTTGAIPSAWCAPGDREYLETVLGRLRKRQRTLPLLIDRHLTHLGL